MPPKRTLVVECYGGPSIGKTDFVGELFTKLKRRHLHVEQAREFAKRWALSGREIKAIDEYYVFGAQVHEEAELLGQVEVVTTDRPVLLSAIYAELYSPPSVRRGIVAAVRSYYEHTASLGHRRVAVVLPRRHKYVADGRYEDEEQAALVDAVVEDEVGRTMMELNWLSDRRYDDGEDVDSMQAALYRMLRGLDTTLNKPSPFCALYCGDDFTVEDVAVDVVRKVQRGPK